MILHPGIYRGIVVANVDPSVRGRVKIFVPGVYPVELKTTPDVLPWAEPVEPIFAGNFKSSGGACPETGVASVPIVGAEVWLFFENSNHDYPRFFGACQAGTGWISEHPEQHVIQTRNVKIRIDENPSAGTNKFDSDNSGCTTLSVKKQIPQMLTRVDVEITNTTGCALNLIINGDTNIKINGDVYEEINGNKHETLNGNLYRHHVGDAHIEHEGKIVYHRQGDGFTKIDGNTVDTQKGDHNYSNAKGNVKNIVYDGAVEFNYNGDHKLQVNGTSTHIINGAENKSVIGSSNSSSIGSICLKANDITFLVDEDLVLASADGNIIMQAFGTGAYDSKPPDYPNKLRGGIIQKGNYIHRSGRGETDTYIWPSTPVVTEIVTMDGIVDSTESGNPLGIIDHRDDFTDSKEF